MTWPTVPLGDQWTHPELVHDAQMHPRIDTPLNAGRAPLATLMPGPPMLVVQRATAATVTAGSKFPWDTPLQDPYNGWNASTLLWTVPLTGLYLLSACLTQTSTAASGITFGPLSSPLYPATTYIGNIAPSSTGAALRIPGLPLELNAGDQVNVGIAGASFTAAAATASGSRSSMSLTYLGVQSGNGGGLTPGVPLVQPLVNSPQWITGEQVHDLKLHDRFDLPMNTMRPHIASWGGQFARFLAASQSAAMTAGQGVDLLPIIDTANGADNTQVMLTDYIVQSAGLYLIGGAAVAAGAAATQITLRLNPISGNAGPLIGGNPEASNANGGEGSFASAIRRLSVGDRISMITLNALTTSANFGTFLAVTQLGF